MLGLTLRRRRGNPNHLLPIDKAIHTNFCKYEVAPAYKIDDSPYLWILKPTSYNRVSGILCRETEYMFLALSNSWKLSWTSTSKDMHRSLNLVVSKPPTQSWRSPSESGNQRITFPSVLVPSWSKSTCRSLFYFLVESLTSACGYSSLTNSKSSFFDRATCGPHRTSSISTSRAWGISTST